MPGHRSDFPHAQVKYRSMPRHPLCLPGPPFLYFDHRGVVEEGEGFQYGRRVASHPQDLSKKKPEFLVKSPEIQKRSPEFLVKSPEILKKDSEILRSPDFLTKTREILDMSPEFRTGKPDTRNKSPEFLKKTPENFQMSSQYSDYSVYSIYPPPAPPPPPPPPPREREWMRNEEEEEEDDRPLVIDMGEEEEEEKEEEEGQEEEEEQAMDLRINRDPRGPNPSQPPQTLPPAPYLDRGPKSWEFLMRLLADPRTNPDVIRWEDRSRYTFRLVQPQVIASLWGQRSNKRTLTYNNFARALRYHYHTKYLIRVSERQLVYGCGQPAIQFLNTILHQH